MFVHAFCVTYMVLCMGPVLISTQTIPRMIPAVLGSSVTLDCTVSRSANSFLVWEKITPTKIVIAINDKLQNGFQNSSKISVHLRHDGSTSLELKSMGLMEDGEYRCYDVIDLSTADKFDVTILVRPFDDGVSSLIGQIDEGTQQTITCTADGGKPSPSIEWYLLSPDVNRTRLTGSEEARQYPNGTWYKRSNLTFTVTREMYRSTLYCLVNTGPIPFYNESFQTQLDVNLSPLMPAIGYFTGLFNDGETKTITCTSAGSRPAATIEWYIDGAKLQNTIHEVLPRSDGTFFVTGILSVKFDKSMSGRQMRCAASNSVTHTNGVGDVNRTLTLLVTYAPQITSENGTREVTEDSDVVLTCQVDARPMPLPQNIFWRHNNNIIALGTGSRFNYTSSRVADLHISSVKREDAGNYECQALNTIGVGVGQKVHIEVSYRPFCTQGSVVRHAVKLGSSVTVTCTVDGNPGNSTIKWRYKGTGITITPSVSNHVVYGRPRETVSTAVISVTDDWQYTDVECVGSNAIGESRSPCIYRIVRPGPPEVPTNCTWSSLNDVEIRVQCNPGFDGGSGQYFVLQQSESGGQYETTKNATVAMFVVSNLKAGTRYSFKICAISDLYPQLPSCSSEVAAQTSEGINDQQALASAGSPNSAPYIAAGVMGAVVLFILIGIIIFFVRRRRQLDKDPQESTWNQNNIPNTGQSKQGESCHVIGTSNGSSLTKNANIVQNSCGERGNNQFILADGNEAIVRHINPYDIKNFDPEVDHSISNKMRVYQVPSHQPLIEDNVNVKTKKGDDFDVNDFQDWLKETPSHFGDSSRHNLCYSEADISMATTDRRYRPPIDDKKSVSLEIIPNTNDSKLDDSGLTFQTNLLSHFITIDNYTEENESSRSSSSFSSKLKSCVIPTDPISGETDTEKKEGISVDNNKQPVKRSSYKLAMHNNDDFTLHDFFSASVEALAALDATLEDVTPLDISNNSDSSGSFKSSSDNIDRHIKEENPKRLSEDNDLPHKEHVKRCHNGRETKEDDTCPEQDYVEMSFLSGEPDEPIPKVPDKVYLEETSSRDKLKCDETAALSNLPSTEVVFTDDYIDMATIPAKQVNVCKNALQDEGSKDESNDLPGSKGPIEKIRLRCKRVNVKTPVPSVGDDKSDTSYSSDTSSESSSSECDSEEFTTPQESGNNRNPSEQEEIDKNIPFMDSGDEAEMKTTTEDSTSPVYF
ncbi:uncharacterized protein LOC132556969 [Ylistrum balloti]|uniref:uncharacterized protein LOC132556969 n=1 Tax=Ylistrum balloti TaxID=509963 RepID=UPI002905D7A1|nr:uncharacterized protein LOC132556969 [Ylistrum balloti]